MEEEQSFSSGLAAIWKKRGAKGRTGEEEEDEKEEEVVTEDGEGKKKGRKKIRDPPASPSLSRIQGRG